MVKGICISSLILLQSIIVNAQNLSVNLGFGYSIYNSYASTFDNGDYQFIYAAPYAKEGLGELPSFMSNTPVYDQVRIASIQGIKNNQGKNINLGISIRYDFKNYFQLSLEANYAYNNREIYYKFQNMLIDLDNNEYSYSTTSADIQDNSISINNWKNTYKLRLNYILPTKSITKYYVSMAYGYRFLIAANYNSYLTKNEDDYLSATSNLDKNEFYNTRVFQDKLFSELSNDGFNHIGIIGVGLNRFGLQTGIDWSFNISKSKNLTYFNNQNLISIFLKYKLYNLSLFK